SIINPNGGILQGSYDIAVDAQGSAYVAGSATEIPVTPGAFQTEGSTAFIAKFSPSGNSLDYATYLGGRPDEKSGYGKNTISAIAVDSTGSAIVSGTTSSPYFPTTENAYQTSFNDLQGMGFEFTDGFVTKIDPSGSKLIFSTYFGGRGPDGVNDMAIDPEGNIYALGTDINVFPTTP